MHNQTSGKAMKHALAEAKGTGIFVVPDVDSNEDTPVKAVEVTGLTYAQCVKRGELTLAFKWVPNSDGGGGGDIMPQPCPTTPCVDRCPDGTNCVCYEGLCRHALVPD